MHTYFYQVQTQLFTSSAGYADFIIATFDGQQANIFVKQILPNKRFIEEYVYKSEHFFKVCILTKFKRGGNAHTDSHSYHFPDACILATSSPVLNPRSTRTMSLGSNLLSTYSTTLCSFCEKITAFTISLDLPGT